jgi:hypothetical protein
MAIKQERMGEECGGLGNLAFDLSFKRIKI